MIPEIQPYHGDWYARPLISKKAEYRVFVLFGKVAAIAQKTVDDPTQVAWNHAAGASFHNVRWDNWNMRMCTAAMKAAEMSGLDYAAIDIMVEEETLTPWIIEVNSAGSLTLNEDGTPSYHSRCVVKCFEWHLSRETYDHWSLPIIQQPESWKDVIHPGVWSSHPSNEEVMEPVFVSVRS